jgi:AraC family transcriptional regulator
MSAAELPLKPEAQNSHPGPIFAAGAQSCVLSSATLAWKGIQVEEYHFSALDIPETELNMTLLDIQLSPHLNVEWFRGGRCQRQQLAAGDVCLFPAGPHGRTRWHDPLDALIIALDPDRIAQVASECVPPRGVELAPQYGGRDPQIYYIGMALKAEIEAGGPGGPLYGESLGAALIAHLLHRYNAFAPMAGSHAATRPTAGLAPSDLRRVLALIHDQLDVNLSLAEMAEAVHLSPYHFLRLFRQSTGLAPHQYVIAQRIEAARCLLLRGELSVAQVAARVGFASQSHLNRHFKRTYGVPPTTFAQRNAVRRPTMELLSRNVRSNNVQEDDKSVEDSSMPAPP